MGKTKTLGAVSAFEQGFKLDEFTAEPSAGIVRGPASCVHVDPKVMDVLIILAARAGEVVSRDELLDEAWSGRIVSDDALSRCVYQLRRHFMEAGGENRYRSIVETIPKRGYRLNCKAPNAILSGSTEGTQKVRRGLAPRLRLTPSTMAGLVAILLATSMVAALFWVAELDRSVNSEAYAAYLRGNDYFSRPDRQVALPYAEDLYRQATNLDPSFELAWIGLARANTDMYWHGIDRSPERLARADDAIQRLTDRHAPEARLAVANYLLKGRGRYEDALAELELAETSLAHEPELFFLRAMTYRRMGDLDSSIDALNDAIALAPDSLLYLRQQYLNHQFVREHESAEEYLERILRIRPDDGTAFVDRVVLALCRGGDTVLANRYDRTPPSPFYDDGIAYTYTSWLAAIYDREFKRALRVLDSSVDEQLLDGDLRNGSFGPKALFYARTHHLSGDDEQAGEDYRSVVDLIDERLPSTDKDDLYTLAGLFLALAEAQAHLDEPEAAFQSIRRAEDVMLASGDAILISALQIQLVLRVLVPAAYFDEAFRRLDAYLGNRIGHWSIQGLKRDPRLESLVADPRFMELERKYE